MRRTTSKSDHDRSILQSLRWPLVIGIMLLGHVSLMMIAVVCSRTIPAATETVDDATSATPVPTIEEPGRP